MSEANDSYVVELLELESLLRAQLCRYIAAAADVEDLLQEAFLRLLALSPAQRSQLKSLRAFALTTARNLALDWLRHRSHRNVRQPEPAWALFRRLLQRRCGLSF